ncbi:MAG TPA: T9SS type A sorting domain-containing protein, partial [Bacteroidia bacterium]|nr:T9SS type A sorting domain-containing protein [Bacteroidia bacterium]
LIFQGMLIAGTRSEGIFKGTDSTTPAWTAVSFGFNNLITHAMVCNGVALVVAATEKGVFVSTDLANSYKAANKGLIDSLNVTDLVLFGHKLFASTKNAGVFMSADTGATWTIFNSSLMAIDIKKLATSSSYIYLITTNNYVYFSDGTNSWNMANNGLPTGVPFTSLTFYGNQVAIGTLGNGVYKSVAGQNKWSSFNNGLSNLNVTSLTAQNTKLFAGTDGNGVFVSDTIAANWMNTSETTIPHTKLMGLNGQKIEAMATYAGYVWASYKGGLLATSDYGTTWIAGGNQFNLPSYTPVYKVDFVTTRVFVTTENNGLYSNALSEIPPANGINELGNNIGNFNVFPNPSNGNIYIDLTTLKGKVNEINVYNQQGKKVTSFQQAALPGTPFQLQLASGIYFIQAITRDGAATQKVIIH